MPSSPPQNVWKEQKLDDMAYEVRDLFEPKGAEEFPYIGLEHIEQQSLMLISVGKSIDTISTKKIFRSGDILFGSLRPYFRKVVRPNFSGLCSTDITVIRAKNNSDNSFIFYFITNQMFIDYATKISSGTRMPRANWKVLCESKWRFPPLPTQRIIAAILSTYDDLIENNTRRIKILEEMVQAIYHEWFVHFRFPGHESVRMVESELGMIPDGWEVVKVPDAIIINPRIKLPKNGIKPFLSMGSLSENTMNVQNIEYREGNSGSKYQNGDTLFARITPCLENGKTVFIQFLSSDLDTGFGSTEFIVLRSKTLTPEFVYLLSRTDSFRDNAIKSMSGATGRQRVQEECFDKFHFAHPDKETLIAFDEIIKPFFKFIYLFSKKNENLRHTRDLLLPKLISGELDVSELNIMIPEAMT